MIERNVSRKSATRKNRNRLATITIAKEDDLGVNDTQIEERSHIGYLLRSGDICLGYNLEETQFVEDEAEEARSGMPNAIVVRKLYGGVATNDVTKMRIWRLQRLDVEVAEDMRARSSKKDAEMDDVDEEDFMREVEADKEMRKNMNIYKSEIVKNKDDDEAMGDEEENQKDGDDEEDVEDDQEVKLEELLDGLVLDQGPDAGDNNNKIDTSKMTDEEAWEALQGEGEKAAKDGIHFIGRDESRQVRDKDSAVPVSGNTFGKEYMDTKFSFT